MKRSEAIQKIYEVMKTYEDCFIGQAAAENLLHHIEQMGMLPPKKSTSRISNRDKVKMIANNFKWDKEDNA